MCVVVVVVCVCVPQLAMTEINRLHNRTARAAEVTRDECVCVCVCVCVCDFFRHQSSASCNNYLCYCISISCMTVLFIAHKHIVLTQWHYTHSIVCHRPPPPPLTPTPPTPLFPQFSTGANTVVVGTTALKFFLVYCVLKTGEKEYLCARNLQQWSYSMCVCVHILHSTPV